MRDVDALGLVGAAGAGLGGDEAVGQLFRAHAQHRHTLARQLAHQLDQVAVACALVAGVARDLDVVGSDDLAHAEDCLNIRLRRVEHPHILGLEVAKGVGRVLGPVEMNRRVWQVLFAAHIELKALLAKLLLKGDAVALVGGHAAALAQRADCGLRKRSRSRVGDDAHLLNIGVGVATVHGQQVAAIFGHRHRDLTLAKSRVERDLDQRGLVLAGIARVALSQRLGVKEQGVGCQTGTGHRDPLGRDLANVERRQRTAETDGEGADVAGGVPGHRDGTAGLGRRDAEQPRHRHPYRFGVLEGAVGKGQRRRGLVAQLEHKALVGIGLGVDDLEHLLLIAGLAQAEQRDRVGDLGLAQRQAEDRVGSERLGGHVQIEHLQLGDALHPGHHLRGIDPLGLGGGVCARAGIGSCVGSCVRVPLVDRRLLQCGLDLDLGRAGGKGHHPLARLAAELDRGFWGAVFKQGLARLVCRRCELGRQLAGCHTNGHVFERVLDASDRQPQIEQGLIRRGLQINEETRTRTRLALGLGGGAGLDASACLADLQLIEVGVGIAARHGEQVAALGARADGDQARAKGLVERGLDQRNLACRAARGAAIAQRAGCKGQLAGRAGQNHLQFRQIGRGLVLGDIVYGEGAPALRVGAVAHLGALDVGMLGQLVCHLFGVEFGVARVDDF